MDGVTSGWTNQQTYGLMEIVISSYYFDSKLSDIFFVVTCKMSLCWTHQCWTWRIFLIGFSILSARMTLIWNCRKDVLQESAKIILSWIESKWLLAGHTLRKRMLMQTFWLGFSGNKFGLSAPHTWFSACNPILAQVGEQ